jgi:hypothetical protein
VPKPPSLSVRGLLSGHFWKPTGTGQAAGLAFIWPLLHDFHVHHQILRMHKQRRTYLYVLPQAGMQDQAHRSKEKLDVLHIEHAPQAVSTLVRRQP